MREARLAALQSEDDAAKEINGRKRNAVGEKRCLLLFVRRWSTRRRTSRDWRGPARSSPASSLSSPAAITAKKEFQQIAATAEKWIPIAGVPPAGCAVGSSSGGATAMVVALEQATGSSDLAARDLSLPTPAVLLLGAEGEGVPNALFDLVDCCVEIPQLGVVRSLNVHVSGAIAVWMFARQVLLKAAGPSGRDAELAALKADCLKISLSNPAFKEKRAALKAEDGGPRGPPPAAAGVPKPNEKKATS